MTIGVIGVIDFLTGYELGFSVFYVLPISLITWLKGRWLGLLAAFVSAFVWFIADIATGHPYSHALILIWNTFIRFAFFVITTVLLSALRSSLQRESELARIDHLTGAVNSRFFHELAQMEVDRLQRYKHPLSLAYIDLDNFKIINDRFGHASGDQVLRAVASAIRKDMRKTDILARLGGDEFALLLPETNQNSARATLNKIHVDLQMEMRRNNLPITFSIGVLTCKVAPLSTEDLLKIADELMYSVKRDGKNAIRFSIYAG